MIFSQYSDSIERYWRWLFSACTCLLLLWLLGYHYQIILAAVPLDYYEGTTLLITGLIAEGNNPYTFEYQPAAMYVYPPLYNMLVAPMTWVVDNSLQLHRLVSAVFIIACCGICADAVYRCGGGLRHSAGAGMLLYAALLFYGTPVASTNAMGVFLYLLILYLPWRLNFSNPSLAVACVLAILAFYTKQYFILAMALLCLYLFLYVSMRRALLLGCSYAALLVGSVFWVHYSSPYYLDNTFFSPMIAADRLQMLSIAQLQFGEFLRLYWPLLTICLACMFVAVRGEGWKPWLRSTAGMLRWRGHLATNPGIDYPPSHYFWFCFLVASVVVWFSLGRNPGNYMTYLFQLLTPPLLIGFFGLLARQKSELTVLAPLVLVCYYQAWALLPKDFSATPENWQRMDQLISSSNKVLSSQMLVATLLKHGKDVEQDGHTFYFPLAADKLPLFIKQDPDLRVANIWRKYVDSLYHSIEAKEYDLIIVTSWDFKGIFINNPPGFSELDGPAFLKQYYQMDETLRLSMTDRPGGGSYPLKIWRPKPTP
jgi:4-amino-4-deoxy-L-arabinose transferase-like glycosyltransferase